MNALRRIARRIARPLRRVTGVSTPCGGVSWVPSPSDRDELRKLVVFLEDRRALFDPFGVEVVGMVGNSVKQIRTELTRVLQVLSEDSRAGEPLRLMRSACQSYLTKATRFDDFPPWHRLPRGLRAGPGCGDGDDFVLALGELRGVFGACLSQIATTHSIDVHGDLASLLPQQDEADKPPLKTP